MSSESLKEYGAVTLIQRVLEKYSKKKNITFEQALKVLVASPLYEAIFDYDGTWLWKEGPDYVICMLEEMGDEG